MEARDTFLERKIRLASTHKRLRANLKKQVPLLDRSREVRLPAQKPKLAWTADLARFLILIRESRSGVVKFASR